LKNLERAVRVYRALVESPIKVDSASVVSWPHVEGALKHSRNLLVEMQSLPAKVRDRVLCYVGEFSPLEESRPLFQFPGFTEATQFVREVEEAGGSVQRLDNGGLVAASTSDYRTTESIATRLGGVRASRPSLDDEYYSVDKKLPEALLLTHNFDSVLVEKALVAAVYKRGDRLNENLFVGIKTDGPFARFESRINNFCSPRQVLGVSAQLAEAVRLSGLATPKMLKVMEAGGAAGGVAPGQGTEPPADGRGGIAKDQPDSRAGTPADSRANPQEPAEPPTEHVPTQEQGGASNAITLPDGTEVPFDVMKTAFAKMLANLATQVEQGTVGGQPEPRGAGEADAAGTEAPQASAQQQQMAAQTQAQADVGQAPAPDAPQDAQGAPQAPAAAPEAPGATPPAQAAGEAPAAPEAQPPAAPAPAPAAAPAAGGDVESVLAAAEGGDAEALKTAQGLQGQMDDAQKARLQLLLQPAAPAPVAAPAVESRRRTRRPGMLAESRTKRRKRPLRERTPQEWAKERVPFGQIEALARKIGMNDREELDMLEHAIEMARFTTLPQKTASWWRQFVAKADAEFQEWDQRTRLNPFGTVGDVMRRNQMRESRLDEGTFPERVVSYGSRYLDVEPSYGRDYKTKKEVQAAWDANKDFIILSYGRWMGKPINKTDAQQDPSIMAVNIRYKGHRSVHVINMRARRASPGGAYESVVTEAKEFQVGDIVRYTGKFLRNTGMAVGPWGQQKAEVVGTDKAALKGLSPDRYVLVHWEGEDEPQIINKGNIQIHPRYKNQLGGEPSIDISRRRGSRRKRNESRLAEKKKGPPEKWVRGLKDKDDVSNPHALANWMQGKGYKSKKESVRDAYVVVQESDRCSVWAPAQVKRIAVLPEGLDYGKQQIECGAQATILEAGESTALLQFKNGDRVRVPLDAMQEDTSNGSTLDEVFARLREQGVVEAVVVAGAPTSGRGYFVKYGIGPWALRQGAGLSEAAFPSLTGLSSQITDDAAADLRIALAQEDYSNLRKARNESEFGEMLFQPRFQYVNEGRGRMLRDHIDWDGFGSCPTFRSYMRHEGVGRYYGSVAAPSDKVNESAMKMLRERQQEAIIHLGETVVIDAAPNTSFEAMIEAAHNAGMRTTLVDLHVGVDTVLDRCGAAGISEAKAIRAANLVRGQVDELRRDPRLGRYVRYDWRTTGEGMFEGKFDNRQAVVRTTKDVDGDNPDAPKKRKDIVVRESRLQEQLETGDGAEAESCAAGMKEAGEQLSTAREAIFKLTTSTLVQCASMAQATGAKGTQKALDKAQQIGASFLDELKNLGGALDKANEVMKGENGGMGGDTVDQMKAAAEAPVPGVDPAAAPLDPAAADPLAAAPAPVAPAPVAAAPVVPESIEDRAVAVLLETDIPQRIVGGAHHRELSEAVRSFCPSLDTRQRTRVIDRIRSVVNVPTNANVRVSFSTRDHRLLSDVARFGSVTEALVDRTRGRRATLASVEELRGAIKALQSGGSTHALLARTLSESISGFDRRLVQPR